MYIYIETGATSDWPYLALANSHPSLHCVARLHIYLAAITNSNLFTPFSMLRRVPLCTPRRAEPSRPIPVPAKKPAPASTALDAPDNNGLSRGQNFMKVEKWLRESNKQVQVTISPGNIANLEDHMPASGDADVPSERDRLPQTAPRR